MEHQPGKLPVLVMPGEVTVNGEPRPDLGRSFGDTITGGLLKTGSFTVIESLDRAAAAGLDAGPPPERELAQLGKDSGAHYAYIPRMIVEGDFYKLSIKKLRVADGEVLDIYEASANSPDRSKMFDLLDSAMNLIYSDLTRDRARLARMEREVAAGARAHEAGFELDPSPPRYSSTEQIPRKPRTARPTPASPNRGGLAPTIVRPKPTGKPSIKAPSGPERTASKPDARAGDTPPDISEAKEATEVAEYAGRVRAVNTDWDFCIVEVSRRGMLELGDELLVRSSTSLEPLGKLRVSKVEGNQVVVDPVGDLRLNVVRPGFKTYTWKLKE